jgi:hypothetical protein
LKLLLFDLQELGVHIKRNSNGLALLHVEAHEHLLNLFALAHGYGAVHTVSLKLHTKAIVQLSKITHFKFIFKP